MVDGTFDYWRISALSFLKVHSIDKVKLKAYMIFNPRSQVHEYDLTDFTESRTLEIKPDSFAPLRPLDSVISTYNGNSIYLEMVSTQDYLLIVYTLPLDNQNLYTLNPGKYIVAHYIILDKKSGHQLNEEELDRSLGLNQYKFLEKNKFITMQNTQVFHDPEADWMYIMEIK